MLQRIIYLLLSFRISLLGEDKVSERYSHFPAKSCSWDSEVFLLLKGMCSLFLESLVWGCLHHSLQRGALGRLRETAGTKLTIVARAGCGDHAVF